MKKFIQKHGWAMWLGLILALLGFPFYTWQCWAIFVPSLILTHWAHDLYETEGQLTSREVIGLKEPTWNFELNPPQAGTWETEEPAKEVECWTLHDNFKRFR